MSSSQLVTYVKTQLARGTSRAEIEQSLAASGWSADDIRAAFAAARSRGSSRKVTPRVVTVPSSPARKLMLSFGIIIISVVYALWQSASNSSSVATTVPGAPGQNPITITPGESYKQANAALVQTLTTLTSTSTAAPAASKSATQTSAPASKPAPAVAPKPAAKYADGSYTGPTINAYYGPVQVKAIIKNGLIADVQFLQYPYAHQTSVYINQQAMPMLTQEAIQAQSAQVNGVSGATFTSEGFIQSLASALAKAKA